jgi:nondiscriminating glutamyl-tRNA synthetase
MPDLESKWVPNPGGTRHQWHGRWGRYWLASPPMSDVVRVRFAPSPTGYLHIGGARTALFNWLHARHTGGKFILRIEDTDQARNSDAAVEVILSGLRWLGLDWDEGPETPVPSGPSRGDFGPYFQSQRTSRYLARAAELKAAGHAYDREGALFFRMPRDPITIKDRVVGDVVRPLTDREELDPDWVLIRSDGQPVFHFVNVVDDLEMGITDVIRGEDHLSNTAKHIALFRAFGVAPPRYAHIPLILNDDGSKMSKRNLGASLQHYIDQGYAPEAVANYLCLLGWSPKDGQELFTIQELVARFDLASVNRSNARFDLKKLDHIHFEHTRRMSRERFVDLGTQSLRLRGIETGNFPQSYVQSALLTAQEKGKLFSELPVWTDFYFKADPEIIPDEETRAKALPASAKPPLEALFAAYSVLPEFTAPALESSLKGLAAQLGLKVGALVQPCRAAVTGKLVGPSLYHLLEVLGREKVAVRLQSAIDRMTA